jgi:hypothetical protein
MGLGHRLCCDPILSEGTGDDDPIHSDPPARRKIIVKIATKIIFEAESFENERRAHQAAAIIKKGTSPEHCVV